MANRYWVGASGGTWNSTTTSWSDTSGGGPGNFVPVAGDTVYLNKDFTAAALINVNQNIGDVAGIYYSDPTPGTGYLHLAGTTAINSGTAWTLTAPTVVSVDGTGTTGSTALLNFNNAITASGAAKIRKLGNGLLNFNTTASMAGWTSGIDLEAGFLGLQDANNKFGTGTVTVFNNTSLVAIVAARSVNNLIEFDANATSFYINQNFSGAPAYTVTWTALTFAGTVNFGAVTRTVYVGTAGSTLSGTITSTAGFTKAGAGTLTLSGSLAGLTGTISQNQTTAGLVQLNNTSFTTLANGTTLSVTGPANYGATGSRMLLLAPSGATATFASGVVFSGTGAISLEPTTSSTGAGITLPSGALASMSGATTPSTTTFLAPSSGFIHSTGNYTSAPTTIVTASDLPALYSFYFYSSSATANTRTLFYAGAGGTYNTRIDLVSGATTVSTMSANLYANQASGALVLTDGITRYEQTGTRTITLTLRGSTLGVDNTISGDITQATSPATGVIAISKADANKWILSGANTYTGTTTISNGTLSAQSANALGRNSSAPAGSAVVVQTTGTLDISSTGTTALLPLTIDKSGLGLTLGGTGSPQLSATTGYNVYSCAGVTLNTLLPVSVAAGAYLKLGNTSAMTGAFGVTKSDAGEFDLGATLNQFTGIVTVAAGTLSFGASVAVSSNSPLGNAASAIPVTGTLKYNGTTTASVARSITFTGAAPALDASGTGAVTYSAATTASVTAGGTVTFTGSAAAALANTLSANLSNGAGTLNVVKSGASKWVLSGATVNYTGTTTVSAGVLDFGSANRVLSGTVSISGGTIQNSTNTLSANTVMTGGTITAELTGAKTLDVNSGSTATLNPTNTANTFSGNTTVASGAVLDLVTSANPSTAATGRVLGTSALVSVTGTIRTKSAGTQAGKMRYGGNLTFNAGSTLSIGGAA